MRQALEHLLMRHGCRRIAFIRGPSVNAEAERRYAIYRAVLDRSAACRSIRRWSARGTSRRPPARRRSSCWSTSARCRSTPWWPATTTWRWARSRRCEERGLQVPSDVAVIGFDDIEEARFSTPPLTTVRQPLYQQGEAALDLVLAQLEGGRSRCATTAADGAGRAPVVRLLSGLVRPGRAGPVTMTETPVDSLLAEHGDDLAAADRPRRARRRHRAPAGLGSPAARRVRGRAARRRRRPLRLHARPPARPPSSLAGDDVGAWQGMISALRKLLLPALPSEHAALGAGRGPLARGAHPDRRAGRARAGAAPPAQRAAGQRAHRERRDAAGDPAGRGADRRGRHPAPAARHPQRLDGAARPTGFGVGRRDRPDGWWSYDAERRSERRARRRREPRAGNRAGRRRAAARADRAARPAGVGRRRAALLPRSAARLPAAGDGAARGDRLRVAGRAGLERARGGAPGRPPRRGGDPPPGRRARAAGEGDGDRHPHPDLDPPARRDASPGWRSPPHAARPPRSAATTTTSSPSKTAAGSGSATSPATGSAPGSSC